MGGGRFCAEVDGVINCIHPSASPPGDSCGRDLLLFERCLGPPGGEELAPGTYGDGGNFLHPYTQAWISRLCNSLRCSDHFCEVMNSEVNDSVSNSVTEMLRTLKYVEE